VGPDGAPPYRHPGPRGADTGAGKKEGRRERKSSEYPGGQENRRLGSRRAPAEGSLRASE